MDTLRDLLRERREALGYTFAQLTLKSGVSRGQLNNIEKGRVDPTPEVLSKLAPALGLDLKQLQALADCEALGPDRVRGILEVGPGWLGE